MAHSLDVPNAGCVLVLVRLLRFHIHTPLKYQRWGTMSIDEGKGSRQPHLSTMQLHLPLLTGTSREKARSRSMMLLLVSGFREVMHELCAAGPAPAN